jgi:hypothetical protein
MTVSDAIAETDLMNENLHIRLTMAGSKSAADVWRLHITEAEALIKQLTAAVKTANAWKAEGATA